MLTASAYPGRGAARPAGRGGATAPNPRRFRIERRRIRMAPALCTAATSEPAVPARLRRSKMSERVPFVVIGGGVMGLATAWALTRRGERPVVLERFARGHTLGASHGATRNFNNAYADEHYLDLLARAREGWDALGTPGGEPLLRLHGLVSHGAARRSAAWRRLVAIHEQLRDRGIPADLLEGAEASRRWPGMRFEDTVLFSPDAGVARASVALEELERRTVAAAARSAGRRRRCASRRTPTGNGAHRAGRAACGNRRRHGRRLDDRAGGRHPPSAAEGHRGEPCPLHPARRRRRVAVVQSLRRRRHVAGERVRHADAWRGREGRLPRGRRRGRPG